MLTLQGIPSPPIHLPDPNQTGNKIEHIPNTMQKKEREKTVKALNNPPRGGGKRLYRPCQK
ncbi:hypothetical protein LZ31DRAFT_299545 [Colletotrichum somersetense]|nr:hypothetical protein LZ31DRAFT_299545 [Colletotrichum somersetense]